MRIYTYPGIDLTNVYYFTTPINLSTFSGAGVTRASMSLRREGEADVATVVFTMQTSADGMAWTSTSGGTITAESSTGSISVGAGGFLRAAITTAGTGRGTLTITIDQPVASN